MFAIPANVPSSRCRGHPRTRAENYQAGMRRHLQNGDVQGMIDELRNYYSGSASDSDIRRRELEAKHLEDAVKSGSLKSRF